MHWLGKETLLVGCCVSDINNSVLLSVFKHQKALGDRSQLFLVRCRQSYLVHHSKPLANNTFNFLKTNQQNVFYIFFYLTLLMVCKFRNYKPNFFEKRSKHYVNNQKQHISSVSEEQVICDMQHYGFHHQLSLCVILIEHVLIKSTEIRETFKESIRILL